MEVQFAHFRQKTSDGDFMDFAIFDVQSESGTEEENLELLNNLTNMAIRVKKLKIDQAVLYYERDGERRFYGPTELANYLARVGFPKWTHTLELKDPE